jgi:hypothetical protein
MILQYTNWCGKTNLDPGWFPAFRRLAAGTIIGVLACALSAGAADVWFDVVGLEGSAKIQRSQKRMWEELSLQDRVSDNDIVESFFQARVILKFGKSNVVILGPNSRLLVNISAIEKDQNKNIDARLTLFSGGVFVKAVGGCKVSVYTSSAVCELDKGAVSSVTEEKSGQTGFQVLDGSIAARNIAQHEAQTLSAGQTTMIFPGKKPTASLYITSRHVRVLKHFFGDDYIQSQLSAAGITPTEDKGAAATRSFSENIGERKAANADEGFYKRPFSQNRLWGIILDDQYNERAGFRPIGEAAAPLRGGFVNAVGGEAVAGGGRFPAVTFAGGYSFPAFGVGLHLAFQKNYENFGAFQFTSGEGFLDIIDNIDLRLRPRRALDTLYIHVGALKELALGNGLMVDGYDNRNPLSLFHPMGARFIVRKDPVSLQGFLGDLGSLSPGGAFLAFEPSLYHFLAGYYFDLDPFGAAIKPANARFMVPDTIPPKTKAESQIHTLELDFGVDMLLRSDVVMRLYIEYAKKILPGPDGFALRAPYVTVVWRRMNFGGGFCMEGGRLALPWLSSLESSGRPRIITADSARSITPFSLLSRRRRSLAVDVFYKVNPRPGLALETRLRQDLFARDVYRDSAYAAYMRKPDFDLLLSAAIDEQLVRFIKLCRLEISQIDGGLYPPGGGWFASWGFSARFDLVTAPLFAGTAIVGGVRYSYLDITDRGGVLGATNNAIDKGDNIFEFSAGLQWSLQ